MVSRVSPWVRPKAVRHGDRLVARGLFLLLLALFTATMTSPGENPDAETELQTTSALARTGRFALGGTPEAAGLIAARHAVHEGGPGREGRYYSWFGIGQALAALPLYAAGAGLEKLFPAIEERHRQTLHMGVARSEYFQHLLIGWRNPLLSAWTAWMLVVCARRVGVGRKRAWIVGLTYGLCTFAWPQARSTLNDVQATFFTFGAFHLLLRIRESYARAQRPAALHLAAFGACLGGAFLTRPSNATTIPILALAALAVLVLGRRSTPARQPLARELAWLFGPALLALGLFLATNQLRFGDPLEWGYGGAVGLDFFGYPIPLGFAGLMIAPGKGLLWMAPAVLLVPLGMRVLWRRGDRLVPVVTLAVFFAVLLPVAATSTWHGAWTYGPRYILPALPFLWLALAPVFDVAADRLRVAVALGPLLALGTVVALPGVLVDHMTHQELASNAAAIAWPDTPGATEHERSGAQFINFAWDWRFAAPWAHWRILRHRVAIESETAADQFPVREIFYLPSDVVLVPTHERSRGFLHLAWVDLARRLSGPVWPVVLLVGALIGIGVACTVRGLDPVHR